MRVDNDEPLQYDFCASTESFYRKERDTLRVCLTRGTLEGMSQKPLRFHLPIVSMHFNQQPLLASLLFFFLREHATHVPLATHAHLLLLRLLG
jgi:hypothetical protein